MLLLYIRLYISLPQIGTCFTSSMSRFSFMLLTEFFFNFPISVSFFPYVPCLYLTFLTEKNVQFQKNIDVFCSTTCLIFWTLNTFMRTSDKTTVVKKWNKKSQYSIFIWGFSLSLFVYHSRVWGQCLCIYTCTMSAHSGVNVRIVSRWFLPW